MAYSADFTLATANTAFSNQVQMAIVKAAVAIASEARTVKDDLDTKRNALAVRVLNGPTTMLPIFIFACIEGAALVTGATDAQIDAAVSSVWNGIAGVTSRNNA